MTGTVEPGEPHDEGKGEEGNARSSALLFGLGLVAVAFALRFLVARLYAGEPVWDGHYYDFGARRIAEGHGYSDDRIVAGTTEWHPWCHYPVGYSAYLAIFYRVLGASGWVLHFANASTGALVAVVVYLLGREGLSERRARIAGVVTAIHPGLVLYGALAMGELLSALTVMASFWIAIRGSDAWAGTSWRRFRGVAAGALLLGVGALVRPQALLCAPFLALALPARAPSSSATASDRPGSIFASPRVRSLALRLLAAGIACVAALLPVVPWTARNCRVMDGCALVSTNAGWNLAIGAFPRATGRFETLRSSDGCRDVTGQVQQDRCWLEYGIANIRREPGRWLGLVPAKLSNTFDHESFAIEYLREARPADWSEKRRVAWRRLLSTIHRVLVAASPLAFVALVRPRRRNTPPLEQAPGDRSDWIVQSVLAPLTLGAGYLGLAADSPTVWPIVIGTCFLAVLPFPGRPSSSPALLLPIVLVATTALTHAVFFGEDRYHIVLTPAFCLLFAAALRGPRPRPTRTPIAGAAGDEYRPPR